MIAAGGEWESQGSPAQGGPRGRLRFRGVLGEVRATSGEPPESLDLQVLGRGPEPSAGPCPTPN